jgi:hypothetical protein
MRYNFNYYVIQFIFSNLLSTKWILKLLEFEMVELNEREKIDMTDANVVMS